MQTVPKIYSEKMIIKVIMKEMMSKINISGSAVYAVVSLTAAVKKKGVIKKYFQVMNVLLSTQTLKMQLNCQVKINMQQITRRKIMNQELFFMP